jgi:hypothetical protein
MDVIKNYLAHKFWNFSMIRKLWINIFKISSDNNFHPQINSSQNSPSDSHNSSHLFMFARIIHNDNDGGICASQTHPGTILLVSNCSWLVFTSHYNHHKKSITSVITSFRDLSALLLHRHDVPMKFHYLLMKLSTCDAFEELQKKRR